MSTNSKNDMKLDPLKTQDKALFEAVLNTVSDAITVIDKDLKVIFQNEAVYKIYGSKISERCFEAYRGRKEPCENCIILDVIKDGKPRRALRDIQLPDGNILWNDGGFQGLKIQIDSFSESTISC
jgi:PAS domain-containing protein